MTSRLLSSLQAGLAGKDASLVVSGLLALLLIAAIGLQKAPPATPSPTPAEAAPGEAVEVDEVPEANPAIPLAPAIVTLPPPPPRTEVKPNTPAVEPAPPVDAVEPPALVEPSPHEPSVHEPAPPEPMPEDAGELALASVEPSEAPLQARTETARPLNAEAHRQGRALLMLLESGEGPSITIDWPASATSRAVLIDQLRRCHGLELALLQGDGSIARLADPPGSTSSFDLDRWSGFLRLPSGGLTAAERETQDRLQMLHGPGQLVRLFPRRVDSGILGGLAQALGEDYRRGHDIRLAYEWEQDRIVLGQLRLDGTPHEARLVLPEVGPCR